MDSAAQQLLAKHVYDVAWAVPPKPFPGTRPDGAAMVGVLAACPRCAVAAWIVINRRLFEPAGT